MSDWRGPACLRRTWGMPADDNQTASTALSLLATYPMPFVVSPPGPDGQLSGRPTGHLYGYPESCNTTASIEVDSRQCDATHVPRLPVDWPRRTAKDAPSLPCRSPLSGIPPELIMCGSAEGNRIRRAAECLAWEPFPVRGGGHRSALRSCRTMPRASRPASQPNETQAP